MAANTALRTGRTEEAISWARQVLEIDPLSEPAWSALIRALEAAGRHADGLQAYNRYRHLLQQELGCAPGPGLRAVRNRLLAPALDADAELSETVAALITLHEHHHPAETPTAAGPADPAALAAAAEALTRFMHKALTDQEKPPRPGET